MTRRKTEFRPTEFQVRCFHAIAACPNGIGSNIEIARRLKKYGLRLAVASSLRALLKQEPSRINPDASAWIGRLPPKDQWSSEFWVLGQKAKDYITDTTRL